MFHNQVSIGEPHLPVSFGGRGWSNILPSKVESVAGDHDFHVVNFTLSVCIHVDIKPDEGKDMISYYKGKPCMLGTQAAMFVRLGGIFFLQLCMFGNV